MSDPLSAFPDVQGHVSRGFEAVRDAFVDELRSTG